MKNIFAVCVTFCLYIMPAEALAEQSTVKHTKEPINVTFLVPAQRNNPFWSLVEKNMRVAAGQFHINLTTHYIENPKNINRYFHFNRVKDILNQSPNIDYFITAFFSGKTQELLAEMQQRKIKFISIINDVPSQSVSEFQQIRKKHSHWLGQVVTDDVFAGKYLAETLINEANKREKLNSDAFGISGGRDNSAAVLRNKGLRAAFSDNSGHTLQQIIYSDWRDDVVKTGTQGLLSRYNNTGIIWCANDNSIAGTVIKTLKELDYKPNDDVLVGGMDWSKEGIELFKKGELTATIGGHFLDGGITMALVYDYHHGVDFNQQFQGSVKQKLIRLKGNVEQVEQLINEYQWHKLDFRVYSRVLHPEQKTWDLNYSRVLKTF